MTHISLLFVYYITEVFFVQGMQLTANRVGMAIVISW